MSGSIIGKLRNRFSLPLLARDLTQQAGRRSLYITRTLLVTSMIAWVWLAIDSISSINSGAVLSIQNLGSGRPLFLSLVETLFIGILILVPILSCGSIAQEKENDSLQLLLLTRLGPWAILLEKYLSRVVPMLLYLCCALPIFAYLYSLGGITEQHIFASFYLLVLSILQLNAICLFCSAAANKTMNAFALSIACIVAFYFLPPFFIGLFRESLSNFLTWSQVRVLSSAALFLIPAELNVLADQNVLARFSPAFAARSFHLQILLASIPIWISILVFLFLSRMILLRRAVRKSRNWLFVIYEKLDEFFNVTNDGVAGGIVLFQDRNDLPDEDPIAWKETRKTAIGTARYLFRMLVVLEVPILMLCIFLMSEGSANTTIYFSVALLMLGIGVLILINKSTGLITQERMQQTLDVVLTTPISGRDIILQKSRGVLKLWILLMIPVMTVIISKTLVISTDKLYYYLLSVAFVVTTTWLCIWLSIYVGLRQKRHLYAVTTTLSILGLWCASAWVLRLFGIFNDSSNLLESPSVILTPIGVLKSIDEIPRTSMQWVQFQQNVIFGYLGYTIVAALLIRYYCLEKADQLLGRLSDSPGNSAEASAETVEKAEETPVHA